MPLKTIKKEISRNRFNKNFEYYDEVLTNKKAIKKENKEKLIISYDGVDFESDTISINYMSSVVSVANYKYIALTSNGTPLNDAYNGVYKQTISWKCADNIVRPVKIETLVIVLEKAMGEIANIIGV